MGADVDTVTISGYSGGGMAATLESSILSGTIKGTGLFCSTMWLTFESQSYFAPTEEYTTLLAKYEEEGKIDATSNLNNHPIYIYYSANDQIIGETSVWRQAAFYYEYFANIKVKKDENGGHWIPVETFTGGFDAVGEMFTHLYTNLKQGAVSSIRPKSDGADWKTGGVLRLFS